MNNRIQKFQNQIWNRLRTWMRYLNLRLFYLRIIKALKSIAWRYSVEDNTEVILYCDDYDVLKNYSPRRTLHNIRSRRTAKVSLISTALNEVSTADALLRGIFNQSRLPDEIILIDTGSEDGTLQLFESLAAESPVPLKILSKPGANIARGRNLAIAEAKFPIIAVTDFGCILSEQWLENLIAPFEDEPDVQVAVGHAITVNSKKEEVRWILGWSLEQIKPQDHLPSGRTVAFYKHNWEKVGGYPEWLSMTGEDTYFALELKRTTTLWAFVPDASVLWTAPGTLTETLQKAYRWSIGDGEAGTNVESYRWIVIKLSVILLSLVVFLILVALIVFSHSVFIRVLSAALIVLGFIYVVVRYRKRQNTLPEELSMAAVYSAEIFGFVRGISRRAQVDLKRTSGVRGVIFIMAIVPIDDTGGGARWTQLTLEFLRQQYLVIFINKFPKYESVDLNLAYKHPNLVTIPLSDYHWSSLYKKYKPAFTNKPVTGIVELPLADYVPIIEQLQRLNAIVIYDLLDAWDTSLGGEWYEADVEDQIIRSSDLLFATAPGLVEYLASRTDEPVHLIPNAVNSYLFNPQRSYILPEDFPAGDWAIIYIGALWGEWFDWELLKLTAHHYPEASLIVIGDTGEREISMPGNVHFLGLKSQRELPAYLHFCQVAIVPWEVNRITQMTSPLKMYEYLAMGKPVVAPMLDPLKDIPGVFCTADHTEFIDMIGNLRDYQLPITEISEFVQENNWQARVDLFQVLINQARDAKKDRE